MLNEKKLTIATINNNLNKKKNEESNLKNRQLELAQEVTEAEIKLSQLNNLIEEYEAPELLDFLNVEVGLRDLKKTYNRVVDSQATNIEHV